MATEYVLIHRFRTVIVLYHRTYIIDTNPIDEVANLAAIIRRRAYLSPNTPSISRVSKYGLMLPASLLNIHQRKAESIKQTGLWRKGGRGVRGIAAFPGSVCECRQQQKQQRETRPSTRLSVTPEAPTLLSPPPSPFHTLWA